jgi:cobalt-zinc-cadmium efflux system outer membrane protein
MRRLFLVVTIAAAAAAMSAQTPPDALLEAVARAPMLEAARKRIDAASVRAGSAGRLADPEVEAMGSRVNADAMGENRDMWELSVRQPLPRRGERAADRDRALATVAMTEAEYAMTAGDLAADVAMALAEADGADQRVQLLQSQLNRMGVVLQTIEARLAAGVATRIADRLSVLTRIAALQLMVEEAQRMSADARSAARGRLALPPDVPLPAFAAPATGDVRATDAATVALATARIAEANAMGKMARASANPMTSVGLRFERERSSMGNQDTVGLALSSEIPWRSRGYARADARAAEADRAAAQADASAARHRISSTLSRVDRAERVAATARRLAAETQARLDAEHDALTRTASAGGGPGMASESAVLHAIDILDKTTETQLQIVDAETSARLARAELWRYLPARRLLPPSLNSQLSTLNSSPSP